MLKCNFNAWLDLPKYPDKTATHLQRVSAQCAITTSKSSIKIRNGLRLSILLYKVLCDSVLRPVVRCSACSEVNHIALLFICRKLVV